MVQYPFLVDSFENAKGFRSHLIPYKVLETILCQNFAKKLDFWDILARHSLVRYGNDSKPLPFSTEFIYGHF